MFPGKERRASIEVLIVDDDAALRQSVGRILGAAGYYCHHAANGTEARDRLHSDADIAAVLCDLRMPEESALGLGANLVGDFPEVAVVMTAGVDDAPTAAMAFEIGAYGYLIKPFTKDELLMALAGALRRRELQSAQLPPGSPDQAAAMRAFPERDDEPPIRVLVVDDHQIFVQSLVRLLGAQPTIEIVGTATTAAQAEAAAVAYQPDVVLMDFELPDRDGVRAAETIRSLVPQTKVLMLTGRTDRHAVVQAIGAGCAGFVVKTEGIDKLVEAIGCIHDGDTPGSFTVVPRILAQFRPSRRGLGADLGPRELEVLRLMADGTSNQALARQLHLSLNTVRNHVQHILYKLGAHSKLEAIATAVREGIIERHASPVNGPVPPPRR